MFSLPWWAASLIKFFSNLINDWAIRAREAQGNRDLGAARQREASMAVAEKQEESARAAAEKAKNGPDDPRDLRD